jgi:hypothetical protein
LIARTFCFVSVLCSDRSTISEKMSTVGLKTLPSGSLIAKSRRNYQTKRRVKPKIIRLNKLFLESKMKLRRKKKKSRDCPYFQLINYPREKILRLT